MPLLYVDENVKSAVKNFQAIADRLDKVSANIATFDPFSDFWTGLGAEECLEYIQNDIFAVLNPYILDALQELINDVTLAGATLDEADREAERAHVTPLEDLIYAIIK
jgi:hypothetical protein